MKLVFAITTSLYGSSFDFSECDWAYKGLKEIALSKSSIARIYLPVISRHLT